MCKPSTIRAVNHPGRASILALSILALCSPAHRAAAAEGSASGTDEFFDRWFAISDAAKEAQPHWMTPVVTVTPRLEQEFRYDQGWQYRANDVSFDNYGSGKGLEVIPTPNTEVIVGVPSYVIRNSPKGDQFGWADETLLLKYRAVAANEEHGNYIVTGFLGLSIPTGSEANTNHYAVITPSLTGGKGWGSRSSGFDIQSTLGIAIPTDDKRILGSPISWNTTFQGHFWKLWPEVEVNYTYYDSGEHDGKTQVAMTYGIVFGRFDLSPRAKIIIGTGYQKVVSSFKIFNDAWIATMRVAF